MWPFSPKDFLNCGFKINFCKACESSLSLLGCTKKPVSLFTIISPFVGSNIPANNLESVDLPEPLLPITPKVSPACNLKLKLSIIPWFNLICYILTIMN